ncbi:Coiled-coil domain-containing protein 77 [Phytophthora pseudosyringae]|uniref:Coiled-coil domain-containing protein 77 n=1 Tax=Phytophthora pseudosyringae TaxID=221518 RepID=A0A8T1VD14_9STRA|nr:Coiled-coil domain-containing protein 77 [Phytophthora pseudosyringae]
MVNQEEPLLSFGSPRRGFSTSVHSSVDEEKLEEEGGKNATELLAFYRQRCEQFHTERERTLAHLAQIEVSKEEAHRLKWELKTKDEEILDLEESLKKANTALFQAKAELIDLQAENKTLKLQEQDDRQKVQHLLALTQPITEQVTFFRDCRPGTRTTYPSGRTPTPTTYPYPSTMHIGSEDMQERKKKKQGPSGCVARGNAPSLKNITRSIPPNKVLRTVYMPNEQTAALTKTIENLQKQLEAHQQLTETRIQALLDGFADEKAKMLLHQQHIEEKSTQLEKQVEKTKRVLTQTTKDYLVLRHKSQETERLAHEEIFQTKQQCETLVTEKTQLTEKVREETHALREIVREEGNQTVLEFKNQTLSRERDLHILKEQYAAMQEACTKRIQDLQVRLTKLRSRYQSLDKRRAMEMEGFTRDLAGLKRHLQKLEVILYGRGLTAQERQVLRYDENYALDSDELSDEIAALQRRLLNLSADLAEA